MCLLDYWGGGWDTSHCGIVLNLTKIVLHMCLSDQQIKAMNRLFYFSLFLFLISS